MPAVGCQIKPCLRDFNGTIAGGTRRRINGRINDCHRAVVDPGLDHAKAVVAAQPCKIRNGGCHRHVDIAGLRASFRAVTRPVSGKPVAHRAADYAGLDPACLGKREQATRQRRHRKSGGAMLTRRHLGLR